MHTLSVFQFDEIKNCTIVCPDHDCKTKVTVRIDSTVSSVPTACPACGKRFDDNVKKIIGNLREVYFLATKHTDFKIELLITELSDKAASGVA